MTKLVHGDQDWCLLLAHARQSEVEVGREHLSIVDDVLPSCLCLECQGSLLPFRFLFTQVPLDLTEPTVDLVEVNGFG